MGSGVIVADINISLCSGIDLIREKMFYCSWSYCWLVKLPQCGGGLGGAGGGPLDITTVELKEPHQPVTRAAI